MSPLMLLLLGVLFVSSCATPARNVLKDVNLFQEDIKTKYRTPILTINTDGHTATIQDVIFTEDGKYLISASADKTVKVWNVESGKVVRTFRFQIGPKHEGMIFAASLSPDNKTLAIGGSIGHSRPKILMLDFQSGKVKKVLWGHTNTINDLVFSNDGKILASCSMDRTVRIWDVQNGKEIRSLKGHSQPIYQVAISPDNDRIISASWDHTLILWSLSSGKRIATLKDHEDKVHSVVFTPDNESIVSGGFDCTIRLWDGKTGKHKRVLAKQQSGVVGLSVSPDGRYVVTGCGYGREKTNYIFSLATGKKVTSFRKHGNNVLATAISPDGKYVATGGGNNMEIYIWDINTGKIIKKMAGAGAVIWNVGFAQDGKSIAYGKTFDAKTANLFVRGPLEKSISLIDAVSLGKDTLRTKRYLRAINRTEQWEIKNEEPNPSLKLLHQNKMTLEIVRDQNTGYAHRAATLTPDGKILISGGQNGRIAAYDLESKTFRHEFIGHLTDVVSLALSQDGKTLVSGSADQTIRLWNVETGELLLSFFIGSDDEWIAWIPEGFYSSSPNGDRYIGWHVNKGENRRADYYTARQFRRFLYRPDVINNVLRLHSRIKALAEAKLHLDQITVNDLVERAPVDIQITSEKIKKNGKAYLTVTLGQNKTTAPEKITIFVNGAQVIENSDRILKNCIPGQSLKYIIDLNDRKNLINVTVENKWAETSATTTITNPYWKESTLPRHTLFVTAIGINTYPKLKISSQLQSPNLDANAIIEVFKSMKGRLYENVETKILADTENPITSKMIDSVLTNQAGKARANDVSLIFLAGHGITDNNGDYHFVAADTEFSSLKKNRMIIPGTSFDWKRLHKVLDNTMGRRILIVDTCEAGSVFSARQSDLRKLVKDVHDLNSIIYSGTSRQQYGIETRQGGVFTRALIDGINRKELYTNGVLMFSSLREFVDREVPQRIKKIQENRRGVIVVKDSMPDDFDFGNIQHPVAVLPVGMENFVISKFNLN